MPCHRTGRARPAASLWFRCGISRPFATWYPAHQLVLWQLSSSLWAPETYVRGQDVEGSCLGGSKCACSPQRHKSTIPNAMEISQVSLVHGLFFRRCCECVRTRCPSFSCRTQSAFLLKILGSRHLSQVQVNGWTSSCTCFVQSDGLVNFLVW